MKQFGQKPASQVPQNVTPSKKRKKKKWTSEQGKYHVLFLFVNIFAWF